MAHNKTTNEEQLFAVKCNPPAPYHPLPNTSTDSTQGSNTQADLQSLVDFPNISGQKHVDKIDAEQMSHRHAFTSHHIDHQQQNTSLPTYSNVLKADNNYSNDTNRPYQNGYTEKQTQVHEYQQYRFGRDHSGKLMRRSFRSKPRSKREEHHYTRSNTKRENMPSQIFEEQANPHSVSSMQNAQSIESHVHSVWDQGDYYSSSSRNNTYERTQKNQSNYSENKGQYLPSHTQDEEQSWNLVDFVRKRTCRFFLGGFIPSITEGMIAQYVNQRGPRLTKVTIFRYRTKPVVIRLNIENDANAQLVCEPFFLPEGVVCKPWVSQARYNARDFSLRRDVNAPVHNDRLTDDVDYSHGYYPENYDYNYYDHYE